MSDQEDWDDDVEPVNLAVSTETFLGIQFLFSAQKHFDFILIHGGTWLLEGLSNDKELAVDLSLY